MKTSKFQAPTSREYPMTNNQIEAWTLGASLVLGAWTLGAFQKTTHLTNH